MALPSGRVEVLLVQESTTWLIKSLRHLRHQIPHVHCENRVANGLDDLIARGPTMYQESALPRRPFCLLSRIESVPSVAFPSHLSFLADRVQVVSIEQFWRRRRGGGSLARGVVRKAVAIRVSSWTFLPYMCNPADYVLLTPKKEVR